MIVESRPSVECFALGPFETNCFVLHDASDESRACWIVDCGLDPAPMLDWITERSLVPQAILLTHCHLDHVGGIDAAVSRFGELPIRCHEIEAGWNADPMLNLSGGYGIPVAVRPPTGFVAEGDTLEIAGGRFEVWHVPGHSPGSVAFVERDAGFVLAGDTLFAGSIGRFDFPTSDVADLRRSIDRLMTLPDEIRVLPGHGPETTVGAERATNPYVRNGF